MHIAYTERVYEGPGVSPLEEIEMKSLTQRAGVKSKMYIKEISEQVMSIGQPKLAVNYFSGTVNFGDLLNISIIEEILSVKVVKSNGNFRNHLLGIGSVLELANNRSTIWGSGFMFEDGQMRGRPPHILALRGQLTLRKMERQLNEKLKVPLGDPGYLYPSIFGCKANLQSGKVGVLPHYSDLAHQSLLGPLPDDFLLIDPMRSPKAVLADMCKCSCIITSSLHGCILGDALGLRVKRLKFFGTLDRSDFKYHDYETTLKNADTFFMVKDVEDIFSASQNAKIRESQIDTKSLLDALLVNIDVLR